MKKLFYPVAALILIAASAFTGIIFQDWKINETYSVKFTSDGDPAEGIFKGLKGTVTFDEKKLSASEFDVTIEVATINTGNGMQNNHAKSDKWFDAAKYPVIRFASSQITTASGGYSVKGTLEIHGVKKEITIPFTFKRTADGGIFNGTFEVNRNDFNIGDPNNTKAASVLKVELTVPVSKA